MRWIFLMLLAANIAYLGWELSQPERPSRPAVPIDESVASIVLLRELSGDVSAAAAVIETAPVEDSSSQAKTATSQEAAGTAEPEVVAAAPPTEPEPTSAEPVSACYTLGPFREIEDLRKLIRDIRDFVAEASFRSREESEQSMYWVYLPAQKDRETANALAAELKLRKIRDYYVVNSGEQVNAVSLGHFREKSGALSVLQKVKQAGFSPVMEPVFKTYTIYWLDYRVQTDRVIPRSVLDLSAMPGVSRLARSCE